MARDSAEFRELEQQGKAFRSGRGSFWALLVGVVLVAAGVIVAVVVSGGDKGPYEQLGRNITGPKRELFDGFFTCTFGRRVRFQNNDEFMSAWHTRAAIGGRRFPPRLREQCAPRLSQLEARFEALIVPDEMGAGVRQLALTVRDLRGAVEAFATRVDALQGPYDAEATNDEVRAIARAWYEFRVQYGELNTRIREILDGGE